MNKARQDAAAQGVWAVVEQDMADVERSEVTKTPTSFINGQEPVDFGPRQLADAVAAVAAVVARSA